MKLLFIRHAEPDYEHDSITEKGIKEAELLTKRLLQEMPNAVYLSPMGRAQKTAEKYLDKTNIKAETIPWLHEFIVDITFPDGHKQIPWDLLPAFVENNPDLYDLNKWYNVPIMKTADVYSEYQKVSQGIDSLLEKHGYMRDGMFYKALNSNDDTIMFFCHFGVECVLLSHLLNISPVLLWQGFCAAPSSVTTVYTEEREKGIVQFRVSSFGDISHLYSGNEKPSFAARFCETYDNKDERH